MQRICTWVLQTSYSWCASAFQPDRDSRRQPCATPRTIGYRIPAASWRDNTIPPAVLFSDEPIRKGLGDFQKTMVEAVCQDHCPLQSWSLWIGHHFDARKRWKAHVIQSSTRSRQVFSAKSRWLTSLIFSYVVNIRSINFQCG